MYSAALVWNVLYISIKSTWSNVLLKADISLLIFCLDGLSIEVNGVLKSATIIVLLSITPFMSVNRYSKVLWEMWVQHHAFEALSLFLLQCSVFQNKKPALGANHCQSSARKSHQSHH